MERIKVELSPVTRTAGPLNVELELDVDANVVQEAKCNGSLYRGFENMLVGRKLEDAPYLSQRVCGICSLAHGLVSSQAVEAALSWPVTTAATILRDVMLGMELLQNHIRHFYLLCLPDYINSPRLPFQPQNGADYRFNQGETDTLVEHYFLAIAASRLTQENMALFAAKAPHAHGILPGGVSVPPTAPLVVKALSNLQQITSFVQDIYQADVALLQERYADYYQVGIGPGNFMSFGGFRLNGPGLFPSGVYYDGKRDSFTPEKITVATSYSWFRLGNPQMPDPDKRPAYTWVKAPRYEEKPMEVGPLARAVIAGRMPPQSSTMARIVARTGESVLISSRLADWLQRLDPQASYYISEHKASRLSGEGCTEVHRGSLLHRVFNDKGRIRSYELITPSEWNFSPRDQRMIPGPVEQSLTGIRIADPGRPVEAYRTLRSYDPCVTCATHLLRSGRRLHRE